MYLWNYDCTVGPHSLQGKIGCGALRDIKVCQIMKEYVLTKFKVEILGIWVISTYVLIYSKYIFGPSIIFPWNKYLRTETKILEKL